MCTTTFRIKWALRSGQVECLREKRYNIMTTNIVEALNSKLKRVRQYPLLLLLGMIMEKIVEWFNERQETDENLTSLLTPECERRLHLLWAKADTLAPT